jgi:hypothetical protein
MGGMYYLRGEERVYRALVGEKGMMPLERHTERWEDNILMDI